MFPVIQFSVTNLHVSLSSNLTASHINQCLDKPSKPEGPMIIQEISHEAVQIKWRAPLDDGGLEISQYSIERCDPTQKAWIKVADVDAHIDTFCIQKLLEDAEYLFRVMAANPVGVSEPLESEPVTIKKTLQPPSPPRGPGQVSGMTDTSFTLMWQPPASDGGSKIIEYYVEIKESKKKVWRNVGTTVGNATSLSIKELVKNEAYDFRITAKNKIGTSAPFVTEESIVAGQSKSKYGNFGVFLRGFNVKFENKWIVIQTLFLSIQGEETEEPVISKSLCE